MFGDAVLLKKTFLYRVIRFGEHRGLTPQKPDSSMDLTYSGWWFVQRVHVNDLLVWWTISWRSIWPLIEIDLTKKLAQRDETGKRQTGLPKEIKIELDFTPGLRIRRFRVWLDQEIRYDEIS
ncbi:hypothetical protein LF1_18520 [Rubripirellula obstinata]|uniref:Uncharacterized protein n=2 Tax=Rubripirellula obstinata TaxID=406547 RepID=A0A5B1CGK8_9BACT|nr:hypothetical protein LF1_18520 [Rubripirellula obstinata]